MDEDALRAQSNLGFKAKQLLENEVLKETLAYMRNTYIQAWTVGLTVEKREQAWGLIKNLDLFELHLQTILDAGKLADRQIHDLVVANKRRAA